MVNFYYNRFLLNACYSIINDQESEAYKNCMNDKVIKETNNTDSLLREVSETVTTIQKLREIMLDKEFKMKNGNIEIFSNPLLFEIDQFKSLEYIYYNFVIPISDNFASISLESLNDYLSNNRMIAIILCLLFGFLTLMFSLYITFVLTGNLIHFLSISRCVLRIIPTTVITNTKELENWLENKLEMKN